MFHKPLRIVLLLLTFALLSLILTVRTPATAEINQAPPQFLQATPISRLSVADGGGDANAASNYPDIAGPVPGSFTEGNIVTEATFYYAAFSSDASNLVEEDDNDKTDIFVATIRDGAIHEIALITSGASSDSWDPSIAVIGQGCYKVAFASAAPDLVEGDTNDLTDIFVYEQCGQTRTLRVSVDESGGQATEGISLQPAISADGRYVAFSSTAQLVTGDNNNDCDTNYDGEAHENCADIYVYDLDEDEEEISLVTVNALDEQTNGGSWNPDLSADGQYIAFESIASNLLDNNLTSLSDTNGVSDVFVYDSETGDIFRVSVRTGGVQAIQESTKPAIAADIDIENDHCLVAFQSYANLRGVNPHNGQWDVFVHNWCTNTTQQISINADTGVDGNDASTDPDISADGCLVVFESWATNLDLRPTASEDAEDKDADIFYVNRCNHTLTERVSIHDDEDEDQLEGRPSQDDSVGAAISSDGDYAVFKSRTRNFPVDDGNLEADIFVYKR